MSDSKKQTLPERPSFDHLKKQARDLLNLARANDASALAKLALVSRDREGRGVSAATVKLADAQHAIAQSYGFASWPALRDEVKLRRTANLEREGLPDDPERRLDLVFEAIEQNDIARIELLLKLDPALAQGWGDRRPLPRAVQVDRAEMVDILVEAGVSPSISGARPGSVRRLA